MARGTNPLPHVVLDRSTAETDEAGGGRPSCETGDAHLHPPGASGETVRVDSESGIDPVVILGCPPATKAGEGVRLSRTNDSRRVRTSLDSAELQAGGSSSGDGDRKAIVQNRRVALV